MANSHSFRTLHAVQNYAAFREHWDSPLFESENFVALPTVGALLEGWLLVAPRTPALSFAALHPSLSSELDCFLETVVPTVEARYGPVSVFEHGPSAAGTKIGCGVDYAHLHLVPNKCDLKVEVRKLAPAIDWETIGSLSALRTYAGGDGYWYFQQEFGVTPSFLGKCRSGSSPSQLFRRAIANCLGCPELADWKLHPGYENITETITKLAALSV